MNVSVPVTVNIGTPGIAVVIILKFEQYEMSRLMTKLTE